MSLVQKNEYNYVTSMMQLQLKVVYDYIISSFNESDGVLQVVFATVAFAPNIRKSLHWGLLPDILIYLQESGRIGRDMQQLTTILYCSEKDLCHVKDYCHNSTMCRQDVLMSKFSLGSVNAKLNPIHLCCDICAKICNCSSCINPFPQDNIH